MTINYARKKDIQDLNLKEFLHDVGSYFSYDDTVNKHSGTPNVCTTKINDDKSYNKMSKIKTPSAFRTINYLNKTFIGEIKKKNLNFSKDTINTNNPRKHSNDKYINTSDAIENFNSSFYKDRGKRRISENDSNLTSKRRKSRLTEYLDSLELIGKNDQGLKTEKIICENFDVEEKCCNNPLRLPISEDSNELENMSEFIKYSSPKKSTNCCKTSIGNCSCNIV